MQTFLPYPNFARSAECLDRQRLGKQRVECMQILNALRDPAYGWRNHPAVRMWAGYEDALIDYMSHVISEWVRRGYKNSIIVPEFNKLADRPAWIGNPEFHASHRSNLLRKLPSHYSQFKWKEADNIPYVWPV